VLSRSKAISKLSLGLQKYLLAPNWVARSLRSYGYAHFFRLVQQQHLAFSPPKLFLRWLLVVVYTFDGFFLRIKVQKMAESVAGAGLKSCPATPQ